MAHNDFDFDFETPANETHVITISPSSRVQHCLLDIEFYAVTYDAPSQLSVQQRTRVAVDRTPGGWLTDNASQLDHKAGVGAPVMSMSIGGGTAITLSFFADCGAPTVRWVGSVRRTNVD